jgi:hypothetical protein
MRNRADGVFNITVTDMLIALLGICSKEELEEEEEIEEELITEEESANITTDSMEEAGPALTGASHSTCNYANN